MAARKPIKVELITSRAVFEGKIDTIAQLQLDVAELAAQRDQRVNAVLEELNPQIKALEAEIEKEKILCAAYAKDHWSDLAPDGGKTAETALAVYNFRTGQPVVKVTGRRAEADAAKELFETLGTSPYVTVETVHRLNKDAILSGLRKGVEILLKLFHVQQAERFDVQAKASGN